MSKNFVSKSFLFAGLFALSTTFGLAQNASSKATAAISTAVGCTVASSTDIGDTLPQNCHDVFSGAAVSVDANNFADIMSATIKVSNSQSLFVSPSLVTGLYTRTKTKSSPGGDSTASGMGAVKLRAVLKDDAGNVVAVGEPVASCDNGVLGCTQDANNDWGVILDQRTQTLSQSISDCIVVGTTSSGDTVSGTCDFTLTTDLILNTTSAHTFNFIFPNVGVGTYNVVIQAAVDASASATSGSAIGGAAYGLGSLTVESVRMVHDFSF